MGTGVRWRSRLAWAVVPVVAVAAAAVVRARDAAAAPVDRFVAANDGYSHFVVQLAGRAVAPGTPTASSSDRVVLRAGQPAADYLPNLERLEAEIPAADQGPVYTDAGGTGSTTSGPTSPELVSVPAGSDLWATDPAMWGDELATSPNEAGIAV